MKVGAGDYVLIILHSPREKLIGVLEDITAAGVWVVAIDLGYFEDWSREIAAGEQHLPMTDYFFPMWRVERITRDEGSSRMPSMAEQFEQRTGRKLADY